MDKKLKYYFKKHLSEIKIQYFLRYAIKKPLKVNYPFRLENIELTNKCPMKCIMCIRTYKMTRPQGFMDIGVFKKIIDELSKLDPPFIHEPGFWLHDLGESLLHPEFDKMIGYCYEKGVKAGLAVNPLVMGDDIARRLIDAKPNLLFFSLDGHDDQSFYKIRGVPNAYSKSKENVLNFLKIKKEVGSKIKTVVSMVDFPGNRESIDKMRAYWERLEGVDRFFIKPFTEWNGEVEEIKGLVFENGKSNDVVAIEENKSGHVKCWTPWLHMSVTWDGYVVPCCYDYDKKYVLGNVKDSNLIEIWNGEKIQQLRKEFLSGNVENPLCKKCRALPK